jgi:aminoglycoside phosphotransferase (APT) family kinase protein
MAGTETSSAPEGVDLERLREYFASHVEGATGAPLQAELIAGGRSNLTYGISDGDRTWVLRRPPLGHVLPTAHDMAREYRVMSALASTEVPVPRTYALCEDTEVNGAPFYVMEKVEGIVYRDGSALSKLSADDARRCSEELVDVLARIHSVDYEAVGLGDFGRPAGYLERQVRRWGEQWERSKTRELPGVDELARRLNAALPESGPPAIVHGDYRLDNTMMAADDPGRVVAVLDWEMSTLGDPLADVGLFLLYWGQSEAQVIATGAAIGEQPGFLSRDELVARYAERTGRTVDSLDWYVCFAYYKLAIIVEGINARFQMGKTLGEGFETMGQMVSGLIDGALALASGSSIAALRG